MQEATPTPTLTFTMGLPAAGKSTVAKHMFSQSTFIDCDSVKEAHPAYDPANPAALHGWSKAVVKEMFNAALESGAGAWVYDTTGTNATRMTAEMNAAKNAGFKVELVFVTVPLHVSVERNLTRDRVVPLPVLLEKAALVNQVFEAIEVHADTVTVVPNEVYHPAYA